MWTAIVVTCTNAAEVELVQTELEILKRKKQINEDTVILAVDDPACNVGSGSATVNALVVTAEYLSARADYPVLTADVIADAHILIFHHGRRCIAEPCGKGFMAVPMHSKDEVIAYSSGIHTNLLYLLESVTLLASNSPPGVWVCSTDMILKGSWNSIKWNEITGDAFILCTKATPAYASNHGVIKHDASGRIKNIIYRGSSDEINMTCDSNGEVPVVAGIVFLMHPVIEVLLSLHSLAPMDSCTYVGMDSGAPPLQASLYFDILIAMAEDTTEEQFMQGKLGKRYDTKNNYLEIHRRQICNARKLLWKELRKFEMKAVTLKDIQHWYLDEDSDMGLMSYAMTLHETKLCDIYHSHLENTIVNDSLVINSILKNVIIGKRSIIQHCNLEGTDERGLEIGNNCFISGVTLRQQTDKPIVVDCGTVVVKFPIEIPEVGKRSFVNVVFGIEDSIRDDYFKGGTTLKSTIIENKLNQNCIMPADIWSNNETSLFTAKLYPTEDDMQLKDLLDFMFSSDVTVSSVIVQKWKNSFRYSMEDLLKAVTDGISVRRNLYANIAALKIKSVIDGSTIETSLLKCFRCAVAEGWENSLLLQLDQIACTFDGNNWNPGKAARSLACIADLLSCIAGKQGGLRSGPASNSCWKEAFSVLEMGTSGSIAEGVRLLSVVRDEWRRQNALWQMRAARHYEGAAQILIRQAVSTAEQFVIVREKPMPSMGKWVTAECPARVDLQGGWTDTPPVCYELGGSVVNVALLINNQRPIGAKAKRIEIPELRLQLGLDLETSIRIEVKSLSELKNYHHLSSPGALLKAAVVCAKVVDVDSEISLSQQLMNKYSGGLELQSWSHLPQGSGLGTSSILAGAVLAALWSVTGKSYDKSSIIHAVLCIEQMLTTGGGWQDQVGGIMGGINHPYSLPTLPLKVMVEPVVLSPSFISLLNQHLVLIYTGKVRLAKNLLQNVIRNWYSRDEKIVKLLGNLIAYTKQCVNAIKEENLKSLGKLLNLYWNHKVEIAPGCDPSFIRNLMTFLKPHALGQSLAGAGGGGFLFLLSKQPNEQGKIAKLLAQSEFSHGVEVYPACVATDGILVECEDWPL